MLGLTGGGQAISKCKDKFTKFLRTLIDIASLQTQFITLDEVIKVTNRRVNALEYVVIPRIKDTISYIEKELDEESREDFFRLKRVTDKKKIDKAAALYEAEKKKKLDEAKAAGQEVKQEEPDSIFGGENEDSDVVF